MTDDIKGGFSQSGPAAKRHLEESVASGRITKAEAEVIAHFFASPLSREWPSSGLQRRMQASEPAQSQEAPARRS